MGLVSVSRRGVLSSDTVRGMDDKTDQDLFDETMAMAEFLEECSKKLGDLALDLGLGRIDRQEFEARRLQASQEFFQGVVTLTRTGVSRSS